MKAKYQAMVAVIAAFASLSASAQLVTNALDSANNYSGSWPQTANNGFGFGNWTYNNTSIAPGYSGQFEGGSGAINSANGNAFGFYANTTAGAEAQAILPFSSGSLLANQTFSVQMQNGNITDNGGQVGFNLRNSSGNNIFQFYFNGGQSDYYINVWTSIGTGVQVDTGIGYSSGPLTLDYSQGAGDAWSFALYEGSTLMTTLSSASTSDSIWQNSISQVDLFSLNGGAARTLGDNSNLFFNSPMITSVPEPSSIMLGLSGLGLLLAVRRRK